MSIIGPSIGAVLRELNPLHRVMRPRIFKEITVDDRWAPVSTHNAFLSFQLFLHLVIFLAESRVFVKLLDFLDEVTLTMKEKRRTTVVENNF